MKIVSAAEMRAIDRATSERYGVPSLTLMENAGTAVADFVLAHYAWAERILVFCGKGNNGGDGLVAARHLRAAGVGLRVCLFGDPREMRGDAATSLAFQQRGECLWQPGEIDQSRHGSQRLRLHV